MARRKVTLAYIVNDTERKASFRKRKKGVINKVKEISTLCDVDACAIIYGENDTEPEVWPSKEGALAVLARFYALPEFERTRKMVNHDGFTRMRSKKMSAQIERLRKDNKRTDAETFIYKCRAGLATLDQIDMGHKTEMGWVINQILRDLTSRMDDLKIERGRVGPDASTSVAAAGASTSMAAAGASTSLAAAAEAGSVVVEKRQIPVASPPVDENTWDSLLGDMHTSLLPETSWLDWNDFDQP